MKFMKLFWSNTARIEGKLTQYASTKKLWFNALMLLCLPAIAATAFSIVRDVWTGKGIDASVLGVLTGFATAAAGWYSFGRKYDNGGP